MHWIKENIGGMLSGVFLLGMKLDYYTEIYDVSVQVLFLCSVVFGSSGRGYNTSAVFYSGGFRDLVQARRRVSSIGTN